MGRMLGCLPTPAHSKRRLPPLASTRLLQALSIGASLPAAETSDDTVSTMKPMCFDVNTAFLHSKMPQEDKVAVRMPVGLRKVRDDGQEEYHLLERVVYGLPQSGKCWHKELSSWMATEFNKDGWSCRRLRTEPSWYVIISPRGLQTWMLCHVDDVEAMTQSTADGLLIAERFHKRFGIRMVDPNEMLGVRRERITKNGITTLRMTQTAYVEELYNTFKDHAPSREVATPFPENEYLSLADEPSPDPDEIKEMIDIGYQVLVGGLLWIARNSAPDLSFAVSMLQRVMSAPTRRAWKACLHTLKYAYLTRHRGIQYTSSGNDKMQMWYDSSHKADNADGKSQYGTVCMLQDGPISWSSKKHKAVGRSSTMNEYMALGHAVIEAIHKRNVFRELGLDVSTPTPCMGDNDQATSLAFEDRVTQGNKMIDLEYHYTKEKHEAGEIATFRCDTLDNISDPFTKALSRQYCERLIPVLTGTGGKLPPVPTTPGVYGRK